MITFSTELFDYDEATRTFKSSFPRLTGKPYHGGTNSWHMLTPDGKLLLRSEVTGICIEFVDGSAISISNFLGFNHKISDECKKQFPHLADITLQIYHE